MSHQPSSRALAMAKTASKVHIKSTRPDIVNQSTNPGDLNEVVVVTFGKEIPEKIRCKAALNMLLVLLQDAHLMGHKGVIKYYGAIFDALHPGFAKQTVTSTYGMKLLPSAVDPLKLEQAFVARKPVKEAEESEENYAKKLPVYKEYSVSNIVFSGQGIPQNLSSTHIRCMCALLVYVLAKQPSQANYPQAYHNRLQNFASMFAMTDVELGVMKSKFDTVEPIQYIYGSMNWFVSFRVAVANVFFSWRTSGHNDPNKQPIITMFNLLDGAGLKYIDLIATMIAAVPQVIDYLPFQPYIPTLARALEVYSQIDPEKIGYIRIIQHRADKLPTSNELGLIVACAKQYHVTLQPTLANYAQGLSAQHGGAVQEFIQFLKSINQLPEVTVIANPVKSVE
ncbi:hypothetical protein QKO64_gp3 [Botrytis cinerea negative-stranded RNA virus 7]|uniref:Uncharacterized protein n=1 Tax=Botrytis cinerea negative-stranded RNA virus 7 TaxID=2731253 RepID=A0A7D4XD20_9MONO|nr:hypothetical protein QKO64_gp3 [Botrytis cinerea negative-stranded RNA virus 7]QKW91272.1 hypothetical protein [Botrytis cinerea negative-stranded RNA virus 7]